MNKAMVKTEKGHGNGVFGWLSPLYMRVELSAAFVSFIIAH